MKKFIKILGVFLGVILCCHNLCYADVIELPQKDDFNLNINMLLIVGIIIFITLLISFISLKVTVKQEEAQGHIDKNTHKKIENDICIIVLTVFITTIFFMYNINYYPWIWIWMIPIIILLLISIHSRAKENKKIAYILYAIAIVIFVLICIYGNNIKKDEINKKEETRYSKLYETFNSRFIAYEGQNKKASEVRSLYNAVIASNIQSQSDSSDRTISIFGAVTLDKENPSNQKPTLSNSKLYNIKMIYNEYRRIESIYIEEVN